jgi:hypothetical protein
MPAFNQSSSSNPDPLQNSPEFLGETFALPQEVPSFSTYKEIYAPGAVVEKDFTPLNKRGIPEAIPFLMKMVDRNLKTSGISLRNITNDPSLYVLTGLKLSPNPTTFSINSAKIINRYNTMTRWVEEHWGDEIDSLMFSGSTLSFLGYGPSSRGPGGDVGLTVTDRGYTNAYAMIKEMVRFFKNNGMIYQDNKTFDGMGIPGSSTEKFLANSFNSKFRENHPLTGVAKERLYINLFFDYVSFIGYFESFDIIEDSNAPYRFTYNCVFKAERTKYHQGKTALSKLAL